MRPDTESNTVTLAKLAAQDVAASSGGITKITVNPQKSGDTGFFKAEGPSFRDVLDAINPLNHIPIISDIYQSAVDHVPSVGSQLAGGALFGGAIGFAASLINVIFEQESGKSAMGTMVAALSGDTPGATQVADASGTASTTESAAPVTQLAMADTTPLPANASTSSRDQALLSLYGGSAPSAHRSYQKAQLLPYLKDVNHSQVL